MADEVPQEPKSHIGERFTAQMKSLSAYALASAASSLEGGPAQWYRPEGFTGGLADMEGLDEALSRNEQVEDFRSATKDYKASGTTGDLLMTQLQGDMMACLERAYRSRHQSSCSSRIRSAGRDLAHGHEYGAIQLGLTGHITDIDRCNKGES